MPYWELYYHMVWATKDRMPLITPDIEPTIYNIIRSVALKHKAQLYAINGGVEHVHAVGTVPPSIALATFIGKMKGETSTLVNKQQGVYGAFGWQTDYSVFSFDAIRLPNYLAYVHRQKEHHAQGTTIALLERTDRDPIDRMREEDLIYAVEDPTWRAELLEMARQTGMLI